MPGYVIHLAVANMYLKKHKEPKEDYNQFIDGVISPDMTEDKTKTHYGNGSSNSNICKFLEDKNLNESYNRGHFLHILTDYIFYNKFILYFSKDIYNDYDLSNKELIDKYDIKLPDKIKDKVFYKEDGEMKIFSMELIEAFIDYVGSLNIDEIAKEAIENPEKWTKIRPLIKNEQYDNERKY